MPTLKPRLRKRSASRPKRPACELAKEVDELFAQNEPFDFDFELTDTDGKPIALADFAGKVLIVDVWGTWCPPCRMEVPHFVALQKTFADAGLAIVGLNRENAPSPEQAVKLVQDFRKDNGMNYRCALVAEDTLSQVPEFRGFPTTMFFDRNGEVRAKVVGYQDYEKLEIMVRKLLDEKFDGVVKKKPHLAFGVPGFVRRTAWQVPEQGGVQAHLWITSYSPDGRTYLAFGDTGPRGVVRLFDLASGKPLHDFRTDKDVWYSNGAFLPNGQQLVTAYSNDKNVYLWDVATGKLVREFQGHTADGVVVFVAHDGGSLISSAKDDTLRRWDVASGSEVWSQQVPGEQIARAAISSDDRLILTSGADRMLRIRDVKTGAVVATLEGHTAACAGDFSPDGTQVLSWGEDGQVHLWDVRTAKMLQSFEGRPEAVRHAWMLDGGRQVLTWGKDLVFRVCDAATGRTLREIKLADMAPTGWNEAAVSPDGRHLLAVNSDQGDVRLIDMTSGEERYRSPKGKLLRARGFSFSADGRQVVAGSFRAGVYLVELPVEAAAGRGARSSLNVRKTALSGTVRVTKRVRLAATGRRPAQRMLLPARGCLWLRRRRAKIRPPGGGASRAKHDGPPPVRPPLEPHGHGRPRAQSFHAREFQRRHLVAVAKFHRPAQVVGRFDMATQ